MRWSSSHQVGISDLRCTWLLPYPGKRIQSFGEHPGYSHISQCCGWKREEETSLESLDKSHRHSQVVSLKGLDNDDLLNMNFLHEDGKWPEETIEVSPSQL
jgi:hypothetical protein